MGFKGLLDGWMDGWMVGVWLEYVLRRHDTARHGIS